MSELTRRLRSVLAESKSLLFEHRWHSSDETAAEIKKIQAELRNAGVQHGDRILLSYPNSYQFVTIFLAIIDYGAIVTPINHSMPKFEFQEFLKRCKPVCGFVGQEQATYLLDREFEHMKLQTFFLVEQDATECSRFSFENGEWVRGLKNASPVDMTVQQPDEDSIAILLYTSGTTGNPKAVGLQHKQVLKTIENVILSHQLTEKDTTYLFLPLFHINGEIVALLSTLLSNGKVVLAPKFSASKFWDAVTRHGVTWVSAVPAVISILLNTARPEKIPDTLRFVRSASAQLPLLHARKFEQEFNIPIIESYGMTEAASQICVNPLPPNKRTLGSVGIPVGLDLRIVDDEYKPLEANRIGEISIKGENVIDYYVESDHQNDFRDGWFHTGDLGYVDENGFVFIVGRKKEMVNRGGEKISPYEVENVIRQIPAVEQVAVIGLPHALYGEEVAAYVVLRESVSNQSQLSFDIMTHCQQSLSSYKCPTVIKFVDDIPVGPTGKVQRNKLKQQQLEHYQHTAVKA